MDAASVLFYLSDCNGQQRISYCGGKVEKGCTGEVWGDVGKRTIHISKIPI